MISTTLKSITRPPPPSLQGTVVLNGYVGDLTKVGLTVQLRQDQTVAQTGKAFLNTDGTFLIPNLSPLTRRDL